jgi:hypothetical protein
MSYQEQSPKAETYAVVSDSDKFIKTIIENFLQSDMCNEEHKGMNTDLKVYNSYEHPIFHAYNIAEFLKKGSKTINKVFERDLESEKSQRVFKPYIDYVYGYVEGNRSNKTQLFLTKSGLNKYLLISRGEISNIYRDFADVMFQELERKGKVELQELLEKMRTHKEEQDKEVAYWKQRSVDMENKNETMNWEAEYYQKQIKDLQDDIEDNNDFNPKRLNSRYDKILIENYAKKIIVCLVPYKTTVQKKKVNKRALPPKKLDLPANEGLPGSISFTPKYLKDTYDYDVYSSDSELDSEDERPYNFDDYYVHGRKLDEKTPYYFVFKETADAKECSDELSAKFMIVKTIYLANTKHWNLVKEELKDSYFVKKGTYNISLNRLEDLMTEILVREKDNIWSKAQKGKKDALMSPCSCLNSKSSSPNRSDYSQNSMQNFNQNYMQNFNQNFNQNFTFNEKTKDKKNIPDKKSEYDITPSWM